MRILSVECVITGLKYVSTTWTVAEKVEPATTSATLPVLPGAPEPGSGVSFGIKSRRLVAGLGVAVKTDDGKVIQGGECGGAEMSVGTKLKNLYPGFCSSDVQMFGNVEVE